MKNARRKRCRNCLRIPLAFLLVALLVRQSSAAHGIWLTSSPGHLNHSELRLLSRSPDPPEPLRSKLTHLLQSPVINNAATTSGVVLKRPKAGGLGSVLRIAFWNLEQGSRLDLIRLVFTNSGDFVAAVRHRRPVSTNEEAEAKLQSRILQAADLLLLNEVDLGLPRSDYRDVAASLAQELRMNYVYGVEFIEVDPDLLRTHRDDRFRGLHGNAILSRYFIQSARIVRLPVCHDWYQGETDEIGKLESGRRWAAGYVFREPITRQIRHGTRMALVAELVVPESPTGVLTAISVHLENRTNPACRREQMKALLSELQAVEGPVVLAGDLNTTGIDATPTSIRREVANRLGNARFWFSQLMARFNPIQLSQYGLIPFNYFKNYQDPTVLSIPLVAPNQESALFRLIEEFRFDDGGAFDFRGQATLSNSNKRSWKGFKATFRFGRAFGGIGQYKLDWILVKPFITHPRREGQNFRFAPRNPETMIELSRLISDDVSDHAPLTVDLPLY